MKPIAQPLTLFLIGATGDLAKKKILRALYTLHTEKLLPETFSIIGNSRKEMTNGEFKQFVFDNVKPKDLEQWQTFADCLYYVSGDVSELSTFQRLTELHDSFKKCGNHLWYIATLPSLYITTVKNLETAKLAHTNCGWTKIMLEKPFGTDLATAHQLDIALREVFGEDEIYRIDHFLAKETVQNLLVFRFANGIFENLWNRNFIDHVQVTALAEDFGIDGREVFYDQTGVVRDVIQNHALQMLAMTLMDEPKSLAANDVRQKRQEVLDNLRPFTKENLKEHVSFGQYTAGEIDGKPVKGYLEEKNIPTGSKTETAAALRCFIDNDRWRGVPLYVRSGKRMTRTVTEISIQFKEPPNAMFSEIDAKQKGNVLTLRIQPNEGVVVRLKVKKPGLHLELEEVPMQFCYHNQFQMGFVEAYVKLIYDAVQGDPTLFPRADGIETSWNFVQPLLDHKQTPEFTPDPYVAGSWGPASFDALIQQDGREWIQPSVEVCMLPGAPVMIE